MDHSKDGEKHGQGVEVEADGSRWEGKWRDGRKHGYMTLTSSYGSSSTCEWRTGEIVMTSRCK